MQLGAMQPWFGCKRAMAPHIVRQFGPHNVYWELFCGSCAILFSKDRATYETVNDLHKDLFNLAICLQDRRLAGVLYERVSSCLFHEDLLPIAKTMLQCPRSNETIEDVERAYWYLVWGWMGLNGVAGTPLSSTGTFAVRYTQGGQPAKRWCSVADSIPDWHERLRGVQILSRDAFDIVGRIEDMPGTVVYCDPPYVEKASKYVHDFTVADHYRLAGELKRFRFARVVVSYYPHPVVDSLYHDWNRVSVPVSKGLTHSGRAPRVGEELILVNGPVIHSTPTLFGEQHHE